MNSHRTIVAVVLAAAVACAGNYTWAPTSGTSFQEALNWNPSTGVPGMADNATFPAGTYGVSFAGTVTNANVTVGPNVDVDFDLGGQTWQLTNAFSFAAGAGIARFSGGTLEVTKTNTATGVLSPNPGANQRLILNSGTSRFYGTVGTASSGGGTIEVNGGDHTMLNGLNPYAAPAGGESVRITGGTVTVEDNSPAPALDMRLTLNASSKVKVEGGSLTVTTTTDFYRDAVLEVYTNAIFTTAHVNFSRSNSKSTLNILGGSVTNTSMAIGMTTAGYQPYPSTGIVWLADGVFYTGGITLGSESNSVGILRQSGGLFQTPASLFLATGQRTLGVYTQEGGTARCNVIGAGTGSGALGEMDMAGGTLTVQGSVNIGNGNRGTGRLLQSGGSVLCNQLLVGAAAGSTGEVSLTGGTLAATGASSIGYAAGACTRMAQSGGELIVSNTLALGTLAGSQGVYTNTGGRIWLSNLLYVGYYGYGRMYFNGASIESPSGITVGNFGSGTGELTIAGGLLPMTNATLTIGNQSGSRGTVTISGGTNLFKTISVGTYGNALLRIEGGYTETTNRSIVGCYAPSTSRVELAGGVLAVGEIDGRVLYGGEGYSELLMDGGTLRHAGSGSGALAYSFNKITLTGRGAVIDTFGANRSVTQALSNETGHAGSFTKTGAGVLTLSSPDNAFTGRVAVEQGELAVSGSIYLTGGVVVDPGATLNLASATVRDAMTAPGTVSRIDGTLRLKAGGVLTNGVGASLCGGGVVTGSVVFAAGSAWAQDKAESTGYTHPLQVTGNTVFQAGTSVALTGYTVEDLKAGIPLVAAVGSGTLQVPGLIPVTLDGASHRYWWAKVSNDGKTLTAAFIPMGTMIRLL